MSKKFFEHRSFSILIGGVAFLMLVAMMLPLFATAQEGELPPRGGGPPTPTPTVEPTPTAQPTPTAVPVAEWGAALDGSRLQLHARYGANWPWHLTAWQELWTEVQWSDGANWFAVEGWRGQMDNIAQVNEQWVSQREWWVGSKDFNTGPFRWVVYNRQGGDVLAASNSFMLPGRSGETMVINLTLGE